MNCGSYVTYLPSSPYIASGHKKKNSNNKTFWHGNTVSFSLNSDCNSQKYFCFIYLNTEYTQIKQYTTENNRKIIIIFLNKSLILKIVTLNVYHIV